MNPVRQVGTDRLIGGVIVCRRMIGQLVRVIREEMHGKALRSVSIGSRMTRRSQIHFPKSLNTLLLSTIVNPSGASTFEVSAAHVAFTGWTALLVPRLADECKQVRMQAAAALASILSNDADERVSNIESWSTAVQRGIAGGREKVKRKSIIHYLPRN